MNKPTVRFYLADQLPDRGLSRGITAYTLSLIERLYAQDQFALEAIVSKTSIIPPAGVGQIGVPFSTIHHPGRIMADHLHPWFIFGDAPSFWHYPKGFLPSKRPKEPTVGTIADTIIQYYADHYPKARNRHELTYWLATLKRSISRFDLIVTVSQFSKRAILQFCDRYNIKAPPIVVTYQGADPDRVELPSTKSDYVLHLASKYPHKRTDWLVEQWFQLQQATHNYPALWLVGELSDSAKGRVQRLKNVRVLPSMSRSELSVTVARARALLLPSEIEGFGLPALEAYYRGTPVGYVRGTAVEEILGSSTPGGFSFDDNSLKQSVRDLLELSSATVNAKAKALAERFSWKRCLELTTAAYRQLC